MPGWRHRPDVGAWPLLQTAPVDEDWAEVRRVGAHGLLLVVMGLYWWRSTATTERQQNEYSSMLEDVAWVFSQLAVGARPISDRPKRVRKPKCPPAPPTEVVARASRRVIKPSIRKLGSTGMSPVRSSEQKRSASAAELSSPKRSRRARARV